jgi:uncharacterized secreted protein with C-terminal beta-propeller domain
VAVLSATALAVGCGELPKTQAVTRQAALVSFNGKNACPDLEQYIEENAVLQMRSQLQAARDGLPSWGWWVGGPMFARDLALPQAAGAEGTAGAAGPTNYTQTNTQVAGVDEADFVKNDGTRIFVLSGHTLYATRSWPAADLAIAGRLELEGWPREMFLQGADQAVVFSTVYRWYPLTALLGPDCSGMRCGYYQANTVKVTVVDVSDLAAPRVTQEYYVPGEYNSARMVGTSVRMVLSRGFDFPSGFKWGPEYVDGLYDDKARLRVAYDRIIADNEKLIRTQTLDQWIPPAKSVINGQTTLLPHSCEAFSRVNAPTRLGTVSVVTLDLASPNTIDRNTVMAEPGEIYSSQDNLYIATRHWWWWPEPGQTDATYVHKFDITQAGSARYVASGTVDGHIVDQFSMDENEAGFFRVATTIATRVPEMGNAWGRMQTTNRVSVIAERNGKLEVVGQTPDIAAGERIQSSRFLGDKAYVVTFRQVDPLFTLDMREPTDPRVLGEVTIPGFSSYIHPLDDTHLLTIGTYVDPNGNFSTRRLQLAIFDVSDMTAPRQTFTQLVGTSYGWSEAQWEHKAFNYFPAGKTVAIPFFDWGSYTGSAYWNSFVSDLRVYSVDPNTGFMPRGAISMRDVFQASSSYDWAYYWMPSVRRSVMADDFVYAIGDSGIRVANVNSLSVPLATVRFEHAVER